MLDEVKVQGRAQNPKTQDAFIKDKAVSIREIKEDNTKTLDDIVRSVPRAFTNIDKSTGTINVNVRGMSGFDRVNTMIDGVSQIFYATSGDGGGRGGGWDIVFWQYDRPSLCNRTRDRKRGI